MWLREQLLKANMQKLETRLNTEDLPAKRAARLRKHYSQLGNTLRSIQRRDANRIEGPDGKRL